MKIAFPMTTSLLMFVLMTAFVGTANAMPNMADQFMHRFMSYAAINQLDMNRDQLQAMLNISTQVKTERQEHKGNRHSFMAPIYHKMLRSYGVTPRHIKGQMGQTAAPGVTKRAGMSKEVEQLWTMLSPTQQEMLRNMSLQQPGRMNKGMKQGHGTKGRKGMHSGKSRFEGKANASQPKAINAPVGNPAVQGAPTTTDSAFTKVMGNKGFKMDKGIMNLRHLAMMPGSAEVLQDRISSMK